MPAIIKVFGSIKEFISKTITSQVPPQIDSVLFKSLRAAAFVTALFMTLVTARTYIGENIKCIATHVRDNGEETAAIESFCFINAVFTVKNLTVPSASPHPGVGPIPRKEVYPPGVKPPLSANPIEVDEDQKHAYYQWVPFMLLIHSVMLYAPYFFWNYRQEYHFQSMIHNLNVTHVDKKEAEEANRKSAAFFNYTQELSHNRRYLSLFFFYESLGVIITFVNLFLTNKFLGGKFFYFGKGALDYLSSSITDRNNPLNIVFPKMGGCLWYKYGPTGTLQMFDALCVLPLNIVNEKTYIVLWVTYITLCVIVPLVFLFHVIIFSFGGLLNKILLRNVPHEDMEACRAILSRCSAGDKFMMWSLKSHMVDYNRWLRTVSKFHYGAQ